MRAARPSSRVPLRQKWPSSAKLKVLIFASRYSLYNYNRTLESTFLLSFYFRQILYNISPRTYIFLSAPEDSPQSAINFCPATSSSPHYIHIHYFQLVFRFIAINHCCLSCNIIFHSSFLSSFYTLSNSISLQLPYTSAHKVPPNFSNVTLTEIEIRTYSHGFRRSK